MNTSAKLYAVTFLAASALGVAVMMGGCTVTSGTVNDTDGGSSSGASGSSGTNDSGTSETSTTTCDNTTQKEKFSATCQACLEKNCCAQLKTCYAIPDPGDTKLDCNELTKCITECRKNNPVGSDGDAAAQDNCADECADPLTAADGVVDAYNAIIQCTGSKCNSECD